jgi:hypothetical protein
VTDRSNNRTRYGVLCAYSQERVLADISPAKQHSPAKQQETNHADEDVLQPPLRQLSNGSCVFGRDRYSDSHFAGDAILLTQPTSDELSLDIRTQRRTTDDLMQTTGPQMPGTCHHNAHIPAVEVPALRYHYTPTLITGPSLQHEFHGSCGQVLGYSYSHMVGKSENLSVKHTTPAFHLPHQFEDKLTVAHTGTA